MKSTHQLEPSKLKSNSMFNDYQISAKAIRVKWNSWSLQETEASMR